MFFNDLLPPRKSVATAHRDEELSQIRTAALWEGLAANRYPNARRFEGSGLRTRGGSTRQAVLPELVRSGLHR
jgi:hypothetical protein